MPQFELYEDYIYYATVELDTLDEAWEYAIENIDENLTNTTYWVRVKVENVETGEGKVKDIAIHPEEPSCTAGVSHEWESPYAVVGGIKENPGVWSHGGGVTIDSVCMHCGLRRCEDTWATNPNTGEQGLHSFTYSRNEE